MKPDQIGDSLEPRVASLETAMRGLSQGVADLGASIGALRTELAARGRVNVGAVASVVSVGIVLIAAIGTAWISPMRVEMEFAKVLFNEERQRRQGLSEKVAQMEEHNKEIETQFRWARAANSYAIAVLNRDQRMIWEKEFGFELPPLNVIEIGPNGK